MPVWIINFVEKLTAKPVAVALTHGHLDHLGGCGEWESVLMHPGAEADLRTCCRVPFDISRLPHPNYEHKLVKDGDAIELGGRIVELIDISAHFIRGWPPLPYNDSIPSWT